VPEVKAGLEGVAVGATAISDVDGIAGKLIYRGIDIHELATKSTFEETAYLIWFGKLPNRTQLADLKAQLAKEAPVDPAVLDELKRLPKDVAPMDALRTAVSLLHHYDPDKDDNTAAAAQRKAIRLTAQTATVAAAIERLRKGQGPGRARSRADLRRRTSSGCSTARSRTRPRPRSLDIALILHADHGFNASTFAARVITSTLTDIHSAITGAVGCLKGPLHGGANEAVMKTLLSVQKQIEKGEVKDIEEWTRRRSPTRSS
jgi:citrate synthase